MRFMTLCLCFQSRAVNWSELCINMSKILLHFLSSPQQTAGAQMQGAFGCSNSQLQRTDVGPETKKQRNKRAQRTGEKAAPRSKKRKKEEEEKQAVYPNADTFIQLKQVSVQGLGKAGQRPCGTVDFSQWKWSWCFNWTLSIGWGKCEVLQNQGV